jgi:hypothetical protein
MCNNVKIRMSLDEKIYFIVFMLANVASRNTIYNADCPSNPRNMLGGKDNTSTQYCAVYGVSFSFLFLFFSFFLILLGFWFP